MKNELICKQGEVIFQEGEQGSSMYRLLSGSAAVYAKYGETDEKLLTELHAGDYFGEMAVLEIRDRSATVVAAEDGTRVAVIDALNLNQYFGEHPEELNGVTRRLSQRLRELTGEYIEVCDTLREIGRLDQTGDRVSMGLFARIRKFSRIYLTRKQGLEQEPVPESPLKLNCEELALHSFMYREGDLIFREGMCSDCMYYINSGRVGVYTNYGTKQQKRLTELTEGFFFGEMGLFEKMHRSATAVSLEDGTTLEPIYERDLVALFEKNPALVMAMLRHLSSRLRRLTVDYLKACRSLAEAEEQIEKANMVLTPEEKAKLEYMNQLLLMPEVLY